MQSLTQEAVTKMYDLEKELAKLTQAAQVTPVPVKVAEDLAAETIT